MCRNLVHNSLIIKGKFSHKIWKTLLLLEKKRYLYIVKQDNIQVKVNEVWEILVPTSMIVQTPNGLVSKHVNLRHHKVFDNYVKKVTGGLTIMKPSKGIWISEETNTEYQERMIPVRIACSEDQIKQIAIFCLAHYNQEAMFMMQVSSKSFIISKDKQIS